MGTPLKNLWKRTIGFTEPQRIWLIEMANELGISVADLVRRAVDEYRKNWKK